MLSPAHGPVEVTCCTASTQEDRPCQNWHTRRTWVETVFRPKGEFTQRRVHLCSTHRRKALMGTLGLQRDGRQWRLMTEVEVADRKRLERMLGHASV